MTDQDSERQILELHLRLRDERMAHIATLFEQKLLAAEKALQLQALEYERRLEALNHAHAEAVKVQNTYVPRELFEQRGRDWLAKREEDMKWRDEINIKLSRGEGGTAATDKSKQESDRISRLTLAVGLSLFGHLVSVVLYFLSRG